MPRIIEAEGRRVQVPDDATDAEINALFASAPAAQPQGQFGDLTAQTPEDLTAPVTLPDGSQTNSALAYGDATAGLPGSPTAPSGTGRALALGVQGVGRGVADIVGMPVDLASVALDLGSLAVEPAVNAFLSDEYEIDIPTFSGRAIGGSNSIADTVGDLAEAAGADLVDTETLTPEENLAYNINRFGTQALTGGAALNKLAATRFGTPGPKMPKTGDDVLLPYAEKPGKALAIETGSGVGSGVGVTAAQELELGPLGEVAGALAGGIGGAGLVSGGQSLAGIPQAIKGRMPDANIPLDAGLPTLNRTTERAARVLQGVATDPERARSTLAEAAATAAEGGEPMPTSGIASGDTGLISAEQKFRQSDRVPFIERDQALQGAATEKVESVRPQGADTRAPQKLIEQQDAARLEEAQAKVSGAEARVAQAEDAERALGEPLLDGPSLKDDASETLDRVVVDDTLTPLRSEKNEKFEAIDPQGTVERDVTPFAQAAEDLRGSVGKLNDTSRVLPENTLAAISRVAESGEPVTFKDINALRPELQAAENEARRAGNFALADNVRRLKGVIDDEADRLAASGDEAGTRAKEAVDFYREKFAPFFAQGQGGKLRDKLNADDKARTNTPPTKTADLFLRAGAGGKEAAADLRRILEIAPTKAEGEAAARKYIIADLAKTVGSDGKVNARRLRSWIDNRSGALESFPDVADEVQTLLRDVVNRREATTALGKELDGFVADLKMTERDINGSAAQLLLNTEPTKAAANVLGSADPEKAAAEIMTRLGKDKAAVDGFKAAVVDHMARKISTTRETGDGTNIPSYAQITRVFKDNEAALSKVFTPKEMNTLRRAQAMLKPLERLSQKATSGSPTAENLGNEQAWRVLEAGLKSYYGVLKGGGVLRTLKIAASTVGDGGLAVQSLIQRAMLDPKIADHLLSYPVKPEQQAVWSRKFNRLMGYAEYARDAGDAGDDDDNE